jgi:hypothetical protein
MAKRFTDSSKWNDNWFSNLTNEQKLAWIYILDTCNHSGIWEKNLKVLNFHIGSTFVEDDLNKVFAGKFIELNNKWFIPKFIKFQYGKTFLNSKTPAVISARELLIEQGFIELNSNGLPTLIKGLDNPYLTLNEPLTNPSLTLKDKEEDKEMVKDELKNKVQYKFIRYDKIKDEYQFEFKTKKQLEEEYSTEEQLKYIYEEQIFTNNYKN